jgi:hypothetical protein
VSPHHAIGMNELTEAIRKYGYEVKEIPYEEWSSLVLRHPETPFAPLINNHADQSFDLISSLDNSHLLAVTAKYTALSECDLSRAAIWACLDFLTLHNFLSRPSNG